MSVFVLGIDPGFASVGICAAEIKPDRIHVELAGVIRTAPASKKRRIRATDDNLDRARAIAKEIAGWVADWEPVAICAESMSFPRNAGNAAKMALCWGALAAIAEAHRLPILQATPQEIKQALTGSKAASKEEVQAAVEARCARDELAIAGIGEIPLGQREHVYDAIAAVMACEGSEAIRMARQMAGGRG